MLTEEKSRHSYKSAFALITILFLIWGSVTSLNDVLIPHFKKLFVMNYAETMLVQFSFFSAYFLFSFPAGLIIDKIGYQKGIVLGLLILSLGAFLFLPASWIISYPLFLFALFTLATGCVFIQVLATPYITILGPEKTASSRLNLAEGVTSIGMTFMPLIGAYLILGDFNSIEEQSAKVQLPYGGIAIFSLVMAIVFAMIKLPIFKEPNHKEEKVNILQFRQLKFGAIALTLYVGAEVSVSSFIVNFLGESNIAGLDEQEAAQYIPFYWGGLMFGRIIGSAVLKDVRPNISLAFVSVGSVFLLTITIMSEGYFAMWSMLAVGITNAIMWPNIVALSLKDLGKYRVKASGLLMMAAGGAGVFPVLQGVLADIPSIGIHGSYVLPVCCYFFIFYYAIIGYKPNINNK